MPIETLLNVYLDANIMLLVAYSLWSLARSMLARAGLKHAYVSQLRLLNAGMVAILVSPVFVWLLGGLTTRYAMNISDIVVAQYLAGHVEISALQLQDLLGLRDGFIRAVSEQGTFWAQALAWGLGAGFVWFSARIACNILKLRCIIKHSFEWRRFGSVRLLLSDTVLVPFSTRGFRQRYIVIPSVMLGNSADLRMAVSHELEHFRRRDVEWEILLEFMRPLFFWNPVFYGWKRHVSELREFSCDQSLAARASFDLRAYCECLLRASQRGMAARGGALLTPSVALVNLHKGQHSVLKSRILALTADNASRESQQMSMLLVGPLMGLVVLVAMMIQRPTDWSHDRLMLSTIINLERLDARSESVSVGFGVRP
jgi:hypothetical protein